MDEEVIPVTANDVLVDALVSPTGVIPFTSDALGRYYFLDFYYVIQLSIFSWSTCLRLRNGHCGTVIQIYEKTKEILNIHNIYMHPRLAPK